MIRRMKNERNRPIKSKNSYKNTIFLMKQEIEQLNCKVKELETKVMVLMKVREQDLMFLSIDNEIEQLLMP